jgi:hypothetical protein
VDLFPERYFHHGSDLNAQIGAHIVLSNRLGPGLWLSGHLPFGRFPNPVAVFSHVLTGLGNATGIGAEFRIEQANACARAYH